jgi:putative CocE/NonD family hydrolase
VNYRLDHEANRQSVFGTYKGPPPPYKGITTRSQYVTMRDGVEIAVDVVLPKNLPPGYKIPALLSQTRYWRNMELRVPFKWFLKPESLNPDFKNFKPFFTSRGYALVLVDVRGTGASFGTWPYPWAADSIVDAGEIVDWIVAQSWSNGKVGGYGTSYVGTTAELLTVPHHPAVKAVIPMFNHPDAYTDIAFPGGVLNERFINDWGYFDRTLDRNVVPQEFGFWGRLIVKGVKPVDADTDHRHLQEAVGAHATNGDVHRIAQDIDCLDRRSDGP